MCVKLENNQYSSNFIMFDKLNFVVQKLSALFILKYTLCIV